MLMLLALAGCGAKQMDYDATCTISISCATILDNMDACDPDKREQVPQDGVILAPVEVGFQTGENVFDVLQRVCRENHIQMESKWTPLYGSAYIQGIHNLYEFDVGSGSGWMYCLKNVFPNVGFADSYLSEGDVVRVQFTLALGSDIGGGYAMGTGGSAGYYEVANKDALTRRVAAINAEIEANPYYLEQNCLTKAYDAAMDVLTTLYVSQADVDAALADLPDPPVGHQLTAVEKVPATCETAGVEAYWKCSVCGKLFSDAEGNTEITLEKLTIPATGHAYGAPVWKWNDDFTASATFTCGNDTSHVETVNATVTNEVTTEATCKADGVRTYTAKVTFEGKEYTDTKTEAIPATSHDTELVGAKDATCTEDGYTGDEVCKICQTVVKQGEVIPALGHDYKDGKCSRCGAEEPTTPVEPGKPATGDSSTLVLWLALLAVSGMAVTVIPSRKKRSR